MENLIDFIYLEFEREGYNSTKGLLWKHHTYKDYWVVCYVENEYDLMHLQQWVLKETAEERAQEPEMEKNTSLLIVNKVEKGKVNQERVIADENNVYHQFPIFCERRDELQEYLKENGIQTLIHYPIPPHKQECYKEWIEGAGKEFEWVHNSLFNLSSFFSLENCCNVSCKYFVRAFTILLIILGFSLSLNIIFGK